MFRFHTKSPLVFRKYTGKPRMTHSNLFFSEGEKWLDMRSVLRQLIMRPRDVAVFSDDVNKVVDDLIKRVYSLRAQQSDELTVLNVNDLFFKYAMEGW